MVGDCRCDIVFILDASVSVSDYNWYVVKQIAVDIVQGFKISDAHTHVGVVTYSTATVANFHMQQYYDVKRMVKTIWEMDFLAGLTNTADGILVSVTIVFKLVYL